MPTRDLFHDAVKNGLTKDGWTITADPLIVAFAGLDMYVDPGAEKLIAAEKHNQQIAVEVKSFLGALVLTDFHLVLGQFVNYRIALDVKEPQRVLYLAVPMSTYSAFFILPLTQLAIQRHSLHLIVYDPEAEALVRWIN
jgi:XisH protein